MSRSSKPVLTFATREDVFRLLGDIGDDGMVAVLGLTPTLLEVEEAAAWLDAQDLPMSRRGHPQSPRVAKILEIAQPDEEEPSYLR